MTTESTKSTDGEKIATLRDYLLEHYPAEAEAVEGEPEIGGAALGVVLRLLDEARAALGAECAWCHRRQPGGGGAPPPNAWLLAALEEYERPDARGAAFRQQVETGLVPVGQRTMPWEPTQKPVEGSKHSPRGAPSPWTPEHLAQSIRADRRILPRVGPRLAARLGSLLDQPGVA